MPSLTFFVELSGQPLYALLQRPDLIAGLKRLNAGVAMAMIDLCPDRLAAIRLLVEAEIPVHAWLVLPEEEGYWFTADNAPLAVKRYHEVHAWIQRHGLSIDTLGLDVETPHQDSVALLEMGRQALWSLISRRRSPQTIAEAAVGYGDLVEEIKKDGYQVESYQFPLILDERRAQTDLLQRIFGMVDIRVQREVIMLYESLLPPFLGELLIDAYGDDSQAIGVGLTGGGVGFVQQVFGRQNLGLDKLCDALARASRYTDDLYIFSLEGCVDAGYFEALSHRNWRATPARASAFKRLLPPARSLFHSLLAGFAFFDRRLP
jgi:hypothetical protein